VNELLHRVRPSGGSHRPPSATLNERPPMRHRSHLHRARWGMATIRRGASRSLAERLPRNAQLAHPVHQGRPRHAQAGEPASRPPASWLCRPGVRRGAVPPWFTTTDEKPGGVSEGCADIHHSLNFATCRVHIRGHNARTLHFYVLPSWHRSASIPVRYGCVGLRPPSSSFPMSSSSISRLMPF
jgi:hypothetical protein